MRRTHAQEQGKNTKQKCVLGGSMLRTHAQEKRETTKRNTAEGSDPRILISDVGWFTTHVKLRASFTGVGVRSSLLFDHATASREKPTRCGVSIAVATYKHLTQRFQAQDLVEQPTTQTCSGNSDGGRCIIQTTLNPGAPSNHRNHRHDRLHHSCISFHHTQKKETRGRTT